MKTVKIIGAILLSAVIIMSDGIAQIVISVGAASVMVLAHFIKLNMIKLEQDERGNKRID